MGVFVTHLTSSPIFVLCVFIDDKALCVLPALPSLRGLSKAIRGAEIAGVVVGVALRLRSLRFKDMDKRAVPR